jgi:spore coat protein SA
LWSLKFNVPEKKIRVISHGVNIEEFTNLTLRENFMKKFRVEGKMILYVGRLLSNYRNLDQIIKVMNDVITEDKYAKLWLVGQSYDKKYEFELKKLVKDLNLEKHVKFVLHPSRDDIIGAYQTANVVVFPLTNSDGFGIPVIESGAAKCPIISTNREPAPEIIENGKTGILTESDNLSQLKNAILKILTDEELQKKMGLNGYEKVLKNYTWDIVTKKINEVYFELI